MPWNRRKFLKAAGLGLASATVGAGGLLAWIQPRRHVWVKAGNDARPERPSPSKPPKRVVVCGGGLAGISAATELQARGFAVTLVERAPHLGGKLGGWPVEALGRTFPMEHGFHGFFHHYYNLKDLVGRAGAGHDLVATDSYPLLFKSQPEERFSTTTTIFPLNLAAVIVRSPSMHFMDFRDDGPGLEWMMRYDPEDTFRRFDGMSFVEFMRREGIHGGIVDTVLKPFAKASLNRLDDFSAAEAIRFFHFYFMGNPDGMGFRCTKRDSMAAVLDPLRARFEGLGGTLRLGTSVRRLAVEGGRIAGAVVDAGAGDIPKTTVLFAEGEIPEEGWREVRTEGALFFLGRREGQVVALDGRCSHMGCPVRWEAQAKEFQCPCHAGRYDAGGAPIAGPPKRRLGSLPVVREGERIAVGGPSSAARGEEVIPCDYAVVACDVPGQRRVIGASALGPEAAPLVEAVGKSGTADPYSVVRFWFDKPARPDRAPFYTVSGFGLTDSVAFYSHFQEPFASWARETGGSVVECHAYGIPLAQQASLPRYRDTFLDELFAIIPELRGARVLHEEAMAQDNFTRFAPGDHATRPSTKTPIANLFLAGDHVALPVPAFLMEGAVVSGRFAANAVLEAEGLREVPIPYVADRGPLA